MILSLSTVIALFYRLSSAQLLDQGNAVEFPASFGVAGGLFSRMLGLIVMLDPSIGPSPSPPGFALTGPPSDIQGNKSAGQVPLSSSWSAMNQSRPGHSGLDSMSLPLQGLGRSSSQPSTKDLGRVSLLTPDHIPKNDSESIAITVPFDIFPKDVTTPLSRHRWSRQPLNMSTPEEAKPLQQISRGLQPSDLTSSDGAKPLQPIPRDLPTMDMSTPNSVKPLQPIPMDPSPFERSQRDGAKPLTSIPENSVVLDMSPPNGIKPLQPISSGPPPFDMSPKDGAKSSQPITRDLLPMDMSQPNDTNPLMPILRGPPPFDMTLKDGAKSSQPITGDPLPLDMSQPNDTKPLQPILRGPPPFDMSPKDGAKPLQPIPRDPPALDMSSPNGSKPVQLIPRGSPPFDMSPRDGAKPLKPISRDLLTPDISPSNVSKPLQPIPMGPPPFDMSPKDGAKPLQPIPRDPVINDLSSSKGPTALQPSQRGPPIFEKSTPVGVTQKPKSRDPVFIDKSSLGRTQSTGLIGSDSSQSITKNVTAKEVQRAGQSSDTSTNMGTGFIRLVDQLTDRLGGLPAQRRDTLVNGSVNIQLSNNAPISAGSQQIRPLDRTTTTKVTITTFPTTAKRPVLPTTPVSNQQILQMLNTFSSRRIVLGKSQGKPQESQKSNTPPVQIQVLNNNQGPAQTGRRNSGPVSSLSTARGGNLSRIQNPAPSVQINSGQGRGQSQDQVQSQGRGVQSPSGSSQQVVVNGLGVIDFDPGASDPPGWTNILRSLLNRV
ncbi:hypothetical protein CHS0354_009171 [Potamilus streckersoni]|uniref:Uncharacterized protein n=1 Tax=Potamilus streckersoni TaxID=2493646 RepID=A0AAE0RYK9_9BIVA|nr:hypothetical protein CHS0354_009171 [Potamilus streckersoni]